VFQHSTFKTHIKHILKTQIYACFNEKLRFNQNTCSSVTHKNIMSFLLIKQWGVLCSTFKTLICVEFWNSHGLQCTLFVYLVSTK